MSEPSGSLTVSSESQLRDYLRLRRIPAGPTQTPGYIGTTIAVQDNDERTKMRGDIGEPYDDYDEGHDDPEPWVPEPHPEGDGEIKTFWVVVDPTPDSELGDVCWKSDSQKLCYAIVGSTVVRAPYHTRNLRIYATEAAAKKDAESRLAKRLTKRQIEIWDALEYFLSMNYSAEEKQQGFSTQMVTDACLAAFRGGCDGVSANVLRHAINYFEEEGEWPK